MTSATCCNSQPIVSTSSFDIRNRLQILLAAGAAFGRESNRAAAANSKTGFVQQLQSPEDACPLGVRVISTDRRSHGRQLGDDFREQLKLPRQLHRPPAMQIDEHFPKLLRNPLRADDADFAGLHADRIGRGRFQRELQRGREADGPQQAELVFRHPVGRIADRPDDAGREILLPPT